MGLRQTLTRIKQVLSESACAYSDTLSAIIAMQLPPHMIRGHDMYTMQDLIRINVEGRGFDLFGKLGRLVTMAAEHAKVCPTCQLNARFCSICVSSCPVYGFELNSYAACSTCRAVYHKDCFRRAGFECPMCSRGSDRPPSIARVRPR